MMTQGQTLVVAALKESFPQPLQVRRKTLGHGHGLGGIAKGHIALVRGNEPIGNLKLCLPGKRGRVAWLRAPITGAKRTAATPRASKPPSPARPHLNAWSPTPRGAGRRRCAMICAARPGPTFCVSNACVRSLPPRALLTIVLMVQMGPHGIPHQPTNKEISEYLNARPAPSSSARRKITGEQRLNVITNTEKHIGIPRTGCRPVLVVPASQGR
jgi:hypothetical protein